MQGFKKKLFLFAAIIITLLVYKHRNQNQDFSNLSLEPKNSIPGARSVASKNTASSNLTPTPTMQESSKDYRDSTIAANDPVQKVLDFYEINSKNNIEINYDKWFISDKYIQIHTSEYTKNQSPEKSKHNNFYVVEHNQFFPKDDHPPLVVSHATNQPVPITGNIMVKFLEPNQMQETLDFLNHDAELAEMLGEVVVTQALVEIRRLLIKPKKRGEVINLYHKLLQHVGTQNIEAIEPDTHYQFRN